MFVMLRDVVLVLVTETFWGGLLVPTVTLPKLRFAGERFTTVLVPFSDWHASESVFCLERYLALLFRLAHHAFFALDRRSLASALILRRQPPRACCWGGCGLRSPHRCGAFEGGDRSAEAISFSS